MFSRLWVKFDLFKCLQRCQHTSQVSIHMAECQFCRTDYRVPPIVCVDLGNIRLAHYAAMDFYICTLKSSDSPAAFNRSLLSVGQKNSTKWQPLNRWSPPYVFLSSPVCRPFSRCYPQTSPPPSPTKLPARLTATPARAYHTISAWSPFQRARTTSALSCQTLFFSY